MWRKRQRALQRQDIITFRLNGRKIIGMQKEWKMFDSEKNKVQASLVDES